MANNRPLKVDVVYYVASTLIYRQTAWRVIHNIFSLDHQWPLLGLENRN